MIGITILKILGTFVVCIAFVSVTYGISWWISEHITKSGDAGELILFVAFAEFLLLGIVLTILHI